MNYATGAKCKHSLNGGIWTSVILNQVQGQNPLTPPTSVSISRTHVFWVIDSRNTAPSLMSYSIIKRWIVSAPILWQNSSSGFPCPYDSELLSIETNKPSPSHNSTSIHLNSTPPWNTTSHPRSLHLVLFQTPSMNRILTSFKRHGIPSHCL